MPDSILEELEELARLRLELQADLAEQRQQERDAIRRARALRISWAEIDRRLGISRQAVEQVRARHLARQVVSPNE